MSFNMMIGCVLLSAVLSIANSEETTLRCFTCDPTVPGCHDPVGNIGDLPCNQGGLNDTALCAAAYIITNETTNRTGIYRSCQYLKPDVKDFCQWYAQEHESANLTIKSCRLCDTIRCNYILFNADGTPNGGGAQTQSAVLLGLSALLFFVINFTG